MSLDEEMHLFTNLLSKVSYNICQYFVLLHYCLSMFDIEEYEISCIFLVLDFTRFSMIDYAVFTHFFTQVRKMIVFHIRTY